MTAPVALLEAATAGTFTNLTIKKFLQQVVTTEEGWFCLAVFSTDSGWKEEWFRWPTQVDDIVIRALDASDKDFNVYFSSYLFDKKRSTKEDALPTRTIQADLDNADIDILPLDPTFLIETSPTRYQAYWVLSDEAPLEIHETYSRRLTYAIDKCDRSGWPIGRKVRIPGTQNYKYTAEGQTVELRNTGRSNYKFSDFELLPNNAPTSPTASEADLLFLEYPPALDIGPQELFFSIKDKLPATVIPYFNTKHEDRSSALWGLLVALFRVDIDREQVFWIAKHSENNKFADLRHHADRELAKDVLRAESVVRFGRVDPRAQISEVRKKRAASQEKKAIIQEIVIDTLKKDGSFYRCYDDSLWYVRHDLGRPIRVSPRSDWLQTLLDRQFGLNATETESNYVSYGLYSYCNELPYNARREALSYYDSDSRSVFLHTGQRDVLKITPNEITKVRNGTNGILFPWPISMEPFMPYTYPYPKGMVGGNGMDVPPIDWADMLFGESVSNVTKLTPADALTVLQVWLLFMIFKNTSVSRPILALFGQPGAGKSTIFRLIYALLYGRQRSLSGVTTPDDFDFAVSNDPLLVLDNVDTWERWLPDRLAQSASTSDLPKRKLYTDADVVKVHRQALVGLTAHNPKFGREDVADRLLLITLERLDHFRPEGELIDKLIQKRHIIWGGIVNDIQRILITPPPKPQDVPQFRVEDFARIGYWIASALGKAASFKQAIADIMEEQKTFVLEEDSVLVSAIDRYVRRSTSAGTFKTAGQLWIELEGYADDQQIFTRIHKNSVSLGKKLWTLQHSLKDRYDVSFQTDMANGGRLWKLGVKNGNGRET